MAFSPLATVPQLAAKGIDVTAIDKVTSFLAAASSEVRDAAGVPITRETFTVALPAPDGQWLRLPGQPVVSVAAVLIDGTAVTDWKLVGGELWRADGWLATPWEPCEVTVTLTGGLLEVPADIVDLVAGLVGLALATAAEGGYASRGDLIAVRVDDASEQYDQSTARTAGVMELPEATRRRLRSRFGGGVAVLRSR